jgi:hypothetical protein
LSKGTLFNSSPVKLYKSSTLVQVVKFFSYLDNPILSKYIFKLISYITSCSSCNNESIHLTIFSGLSTFSRKYPYNLAIDTFLSGSFSPKALANSFSSGKNLKNNFSAYYLVA